MTHRLLAPLALIALLLASSVASATTIVASTLEELAATCDAVIVGTVVSTAPRFAADGRVVTDVLVRTEPSGVDVALLQLGGRVGDLVTRVPGADLYVPGEEVVVFAEELEPGLFQSLSLAFSKFRLDGAVARRELGAAGVVVPLALPPVLASPLRRLGLAPEVVPGRTVPLPDGVFARDVPLDVLRRVVAGAPRVLGTLPE